jgi:hypothetical protein
MQAIRQILDVKSQLLNIYLPDDFDAKKVEVIILPMEDQKAKKKSIMNLRGKINLTDAQYEDFQKDVNKSREEWEMII